MVPKSAVLHYRALQSAGHSISFPFRREYKRIIHFLKILLFDRMTLFVVAAKWAGGPVLWRIPETCGVHVVHLCVKVCFFVFRTGFEFVYPSNKMAHPVSSCTEGETDAAAPCSAIP